MMKRFSLLIAGLTAGALAFVPAAASAQIVELGQTTSPVIAPACPKGVSTVAVLHRPGPNHRDPDHQRRGQVSDHGQAGRLDRGLHGRPVQPVVLGERRAEPHPWPERVLRRPAGTGPHRAQARAAQQLHGGGGERDCSTSPVPGPGAPGAPLAAADLHQLHGAAHQGRRGDRAHRPDLGPGAHLQPEHDQVRLPPESQGQLQARRRRPDRTDHGRREHSSTCATTRGLGSSTRPPRCSTPRTPRTTCTPARH